jgi:hypothetical protein
VPELAGCDDHRATEAVSEAIVAASTIPIVFQAIR